MHAKLSARLEDDGAVEGEQVDAPAWEVLEEFAHVGRLVYWSHGTLEARVCDAIGCSSTSQVLAPIINKKNGWAIRRCNAFTYGHRSSVWSTQLQQHKYTICIPSNILATKSWYVYLPERRRADCRLNQSRMAMPTSPGSQLPAGLLR